MCFAKFARLRTNPKEPPMTWAFLRSGWWFAAVTEPCSSAGTGQPLQVHIVALWDRVSQVDPLLCYSKTLDLHFFWNILWATPGHEPMSLSYFSPHIPHSIPSRILSLSAYVSWLGKMYPFHPGSRAHEPSISERRYKLYLCCTLTINELLLLSVLFPDNRYHAPGRASTSRTWHKSDARDWVWKPLVWANLRLIPTSIPQQQLLETKGYLPC